VLPLIFFSSFVVLMPILEIQAEEKDKKSRIKEAKRLNSEMILVTIPFSPIEFKQSIDQVLEEKAVTDKRLLLVDYLLNGDLWNEYDKDGEQVWVRFIPFNQFMSKCHGTLYPVRYQVLRELTKDRKTVERLLKLYEKDDTRACIKLAKKETEGIEGYLDNLEPLLIICRSAEIEIDILERNDHLELVKNLRHQKKDKEKKHGEPARPETENMKKMGSYYEI